MKRLAVIVVMVVALALPQMAQAGGRFIPGLCVGVALGFLLGGAAASRPPVVALPPHSPTQCFEKIHEHWGETRWDPDRNAYVREQVPEHHIRIPCR